MGFFQSVLDPWGIASDVYHAATGAPTADEKRNAARMVSDQIDAYKRQTELSQQMIAEKKDQELAEKRKIDEKQVAALRHRFSRSGFLDSSDTGGYPDTLGA